MAPLITALLSMFNISVTENRPLVPLHRIIRSLLEALNAVTAALAAPHPIAVPDALVRLGLSPSADGNIDPATLRRAYHNLARQVSSK